MYLNSKGTITTTPPKKERVTTEEKHIIQYSLRISFKAPFTSTDGMFEIRDPNNEVADCILPYSGMIAGDTETAHPEVVCSVHKIINFCQEGKLVKTSVGCFERFVNDVGLIKGDFYATNKQGEFYRLNFGENKGVLWCENKLLDSPPKPILHFTKRFFRVEYTIQPLIVPPPPPSPSPSLLQQQKQQQRPQQQPSKPPEQQQSPPKLQDGKKQQHQKPAKLKSKSVPQLKHHQPQQLIQQLQPPPPPQPQLPPQTPRTPLVMTTSTGGVMTPHTIYMSQQMMPAPKSFSVGQMVQVQMPQPTLPQVVVSQGMQVPQQGTYSTVCYQTQPQTFVPVAQYPPSMGIQYPVQAVPTNYFPGGVT